MNIVKNVEDKIKQAIINSLEVAKAAGKICYTDLPNFTLEVPREKSHGDFATNCGMLLAKQAKMKPREIAELILANFDKNGTWVENLEIAGPGFINFSLNNAWLYETIPTILSEKTNYGSSKIGAGKKVNVEFVSANPTGLLHMGNARGAALGDTIGNLLQAAGFYVEKEYYINDAGNQILLFGETLDVRLRQHLGEKIELREDGYQGIDIMDTVQRYLSQHGTGIMKLSEAERRQLLIDYALKEKLDHISNALAAFGVRYDVWFRESELYNSGAVKRAMDILQEKGYVYEKEGALWLKTSSLGEEKDEVMVRSNGTPTYFAGDIAYHLNKYERGFTWLINIWGADHHGHVARMKNAMNLFGYEKESLDIILMQLVRLFSNGELIRMSKRTGQFITLLELMEEVGVDAARYFFVMRSADSHLEFDMDLARSQSSDNPVYYVQYAHARICSILRQAAENDIDVPEAGTTKLELLSDAAEFTLLKKLADFPNLIETAALMREPHRLTTYAGDLAAIFHSFYAKCHVLNEAPELTAVRLQLAAATRITLGNLLKLIGVSAPEKM
ncbi:MAG: arginine--tRNA ligase [Clostridia bacterium]